MDRDTFEAKVRLADAGEWAAIRQRAGDRQRCGGLPVIVGGAVLAARDLYIKR